MTRDIVIVPTFYQPECLYLCLERSAQPRRRAGNLARTGPASR
jgi:hypothetical protein